MPLHYAHRFGSWSDRPHATLHLPPGGRNVLDTVAAVWDGSVETFEAAWDIQEFDPQADLRVGELRLSFAPTRHYTTCYSIKIDAPDATIAYSADTAPTERLARFAHGADLFVCEASLSDASTDSGERGHMDAAEAGREAARAGVDRLLLDPRARPRTAPSGCSRWPRRSTPARSRSPRPAWTIELSRAPPSRRA